MFSPPTLPHTDTLPTNPVKKYSFLWLVANVEAPRLSGAEVLLFPQPLIFLDSHEKEDKVIGLKSLTEIVQVRSKWI